MNILEEHVDILLYVPGFFNSSMDVEVFFFAMRTGRSLRCERDAQEAHTSFYPA
jgi:hypothetical protein